MVRQLGRSGEQATGLGSPIHHPFEIEVVTSDGAVHVKPRGELDIATAGLLEAGLLRAEATSAPTVVLDLAGVSFIDSTGLRTLLSAHARSRQDGDRLRIVGASEQARKLFTIAGVLELVKPSSD